VKYKPDIHKRRSIRLQGYDYSAAGAYFVTLCPQNGECLFEDIIADEMMLNAAGRIVADEWLKTADISTAIKLDEWVVMPNHFHGIVVFTDSVRAIHESPQQQRRNMRLSKLIGRFKMLTAKSINAIHHTPGAKLWQRNYWEHIMRNESELNRIREYIHNNPAQWKNDRLYSRNFSGTASVLRSWNTKSFPIC
jgi:REP element-mobilizing transposase RayT